MYSCFNRQSSLPNIPPYSDLWLAPILGGLHYGSIRLIYHFKDLTSPLSCGSYICMHTIGNFFVASTKPFMDSLKELNKGLEKRHDSFLRQCIWTLIRTPVQTIKIVDRIYSKIFRILTWEEAEKQLERHELSLTESLRKLFVEHVIEHALFLSSWEVGKWGAEFLLKKTIIPLIPGSFSLSFYISYLVLGFFPRIGNFRDTLADEQKKKFKALFDPLKDLLNQHREAIQQAASENEKKQHITDYNEVVAFFEHLLKECEGYWKNIPDTDAYQSLVEYIEIQKNEDFLSFEEFISDLIQISDSVINYSSHAK